MIPALWLFLTWFIATGISVWAILYVAFKYEGWSRRPQVGWRLIWSDFKAGGVWLRRVPGGWLRGSRGDDGEVLMGLLGGLALVAYLAGVAVVAWVACWI